MVIPMSRMCMVKDLAVGTVSHTQISQRLELQRLELRPGTNSCYKIM